MGTDATIYIKGTKKGLSIDRAYNIEDSPLDFSRTTTVQEMKEWCEKNCVWKGKAMMLKWLNLFDGGLVLSIQYDSDEDYGETDWECDVEWSVI